MEIVEDSFDLDRNSFSWKEGKKERKKESSCFQISVLANVRTPLDRGGGGGGESEKKTNQR